MRGALSRAALLLVASLAGPLTVARPLHAAQPGVGSAPTGLSAFEAHVLDNGLRVLVGTRARGAAFSEALLVVQAGTAAGGAAGESGARVVADAFLAGRLPGEASTVRTQLARGGVTVDQTVGRDVAVFRFAMPTRRAAAFLRTLAALLLRDDPSGQEWEEALARREVAEAEIEADAWRRSLRELDGLLWREPAPVAAGASERPALDRAQLAALRSATYSAGRMVFCIWGDTDAAELLRMVRQELGRLPRAPAASAPAPEAEPALQTAGGIRCIQAPGAAPPALLVGLGGELADDRSFYGWQLAAHILGSSHASRLHNRLSVREPFVYTVEAACTPMGSHGLTLRISAQTEELERAREVVMQEIRRLSTEEVPAAEFEVARAILRSRLLLDEASLQDQFFGRAVALLNGRPRRDLAQARAALDELTPAALLGIVRETLRPAAAATVVVSEKAEPMCARGPS